MKTKALVIGVRMIALAAIVSTTTVMHVAAQEERASTPARTAGGAIESATQVAEAPSAPAANTSAAETEPPQGIVSTNGGLKLNFRNAPIELVLNHLSEAAGFIIEYDTRVSGTVNVISGQPMTRDEAVDLLNSVLNRNGYAAVRSGNRTLKIMDKSTAMLSNPVRVGNTPESIPNNDEMVTQIIPIRYVEAAQLVSDISPFVSSNARIIANQAGNSIVITDTQANIRHLVEIISAIDSSAEDVTEVKVFRLRHADPTEMATLLSGLFPDQTGTAQAPIRFGNRGGRGGGGGGFAGFAAAFGGGGGGRGNQAGGANPQSDRIRKRNQVLAVADARTSTVVVTATKDLMEQITEMVDQLDQPGKAQRMQVFRINNADPNEVLSVLQDTVGTTTARNARNSQNSPFQQRIQQNLNNQNNQGFGTGTGRGGGGGNLGGSLR
ncbi:MAG TPA: secretin N-terminal domain-containing protein [Verrucomicrobiae bacterium]|nr:secretin N-terminal domain-containing protein [Verrucomicrobiae bacterium]